MASDERNEQADLLVEGAHACDAMIRLLLPLCYGSDPEVARMAQRVKEQINSGLEQVSLIAQKLGWTIPQL